MRAALQVQDTTTGDWIEVPRSSVFFAGDLRAICARHKGIAPLFLALRCGSVWLSDDWIIPDDAHIVAADIPSRACVVRYGEMSFRFRCHEHMTVRDIKLLVGIFYIVPLEAIATGLNDRMRMEFAGGVLEIDIRGYFSIDVEGLGRYILPNSATTFDLTSLIQYHCYKQEHSLWDVDCPMSRDSPLFGERGFRCTFGRSIDKTPIKLTVTFNRQTRFVYDVPRGATLSFLRHFISELTKIPFELIAFRDGGRPILASDLSLRASSIWSLVVVTSSRTVTFVEGLKMDVKRKYGEQRRVDPRKVLLTVGGRMYDDRTWMCEIGFDLPLAVQMIDHAVVTLYFQGEEVRKMSAGRGITFRDLFPSQATGTTELSYNGKTVSLDDHIDSQLWDPACPIAIALRTRLQILVDGEPELLMDVNARTTVADVLDFLRVKYPAHKVVLLCQGRPLGNGPVLTVNPGLSHPFHAGLQLEFQTPAGRVNPNLGPEANVGQAEAYFAEFLGARIDCVKIISAGEFIADRHLKVWQLTAPLRCEVSERPLPRFRIGDQVVCLDIDPGTTFRDVAPRLQELLGIDNIRFFIGRNRVTDNDEIENYTEDDFTLEYDGLAPMTGDHNDELFRQLLTPMTGGDHEDLLAGRTTSMTSPGNDDLFRQLMTPMTGADNHDLFNESRGPMTGADGADLGDLLRARVI